MTEETKNNLSPESIDRFEGTGLDEIRYWITASLEKFYLDKFRKQIKSRSTGGDLHGALVSPRDQEAGDYHIHANWHVSEKEIYLQVGYLVGTREHDEGEREPFAEEFMDWLGQFFKHETAQGHIHADFRYSLKSRQSKFPLPLKTALEGDAEIDGISLRLPSAPKGVSRIRLTRGKNRWYVEVIADRRITFKGFSPYADVHAFLLVLNTLIEEKKK